MVEFSELPDDALIHIFSKLDFEALSNIRQVDWRCCQLAETESLWKNLCKEYWILEKKTRETWKSTFVSHYEDYGPYNQSYRTVVGAWSKLKDILRTHAPVIADSLRDGITEAELDDIESQYKFKLPKDLRLFYRLCGGQNRISPCPGLFGSLANVYTDILNTYHYMQPKFWTHIDRDEDDSEDGNSGYEMLPIASDYFGNSYSIVLPTKDGEMDASDNHTAFSIVRRTMHRVFKVAPTFTDWFLAYVKNVDARLYVIEHGHILRYLYEPDCVARTGAIEVRAGWTVSSQLTQDRLMVYEYRITMEMDEDADPRESCQLVERHWIITHFDSGKVDRVDGPGVVGEYPIMKPGAKFSWMSRTCFALAGGTMEGHFTMRRMADSGLVEVNCPKYKMFLQEAE